MKSKRYVPSELTMEKWLNEVNISMTKSHNNVIIQNNWKEKHRLLWKSYDAKCPSILWKAMLDVKQLATAKWINEVHTSVPKPI